MRKRVRWLRLGALWDEGHVGTGTCTGTCTGTGTGMVYLWRYLWICVWHFTVEHGVRDGLSEVGDTYGCKGFVQCGSRLVGYVFWKCSYREISDETLCRSIFRLDEMYSFSMSDMKWLCRSFCLSLGLCLCEEREWLRFHVGIRRYGKVGS